MEEKPLVEERKRAQVRKHRILGDVRGEDTMYSCLHSTVRGRARSRALLRKRRSRVR